MPKFFVAQINSNLMPKIFGLELWSSQNISTNFDFYLLNLDLESPRSHMDTDVIEQDTRTLLVYPPPPAQASITLTYADLECLKPEEFLNDSILDF